MADDIDLAQAQEERQRAAAVEAAVAARAKTGAAAHDCHACGDPIPEDRRAAVPGVVTCIDCQEALEKAMGGR